MRQIFASKNSCWHPYRRHHLWLKSCARRIQFNTKKSNLILNSLEEMPWISCRYETLENRKTKSWIFIASATSNLFNSVSSMKCIWQHFSNWIDWRNSVLKADCCLFLNSIADWLFSHSSGFVIKGARCRLTSATFINA